MPMISAMERVQDIQATLGRISVSSNWPLAATSPVASPGTNSTVTGNSAVSDPSFAQALEAFMGPSTATGVAALPAGTETGAENGAAPDSRFAEVSSKYVGTPYVWGGNDPATGLDCSSFVQNVYRDLGVELPRVTWDQMKQGTPVASMADARPGDLVFSLSGNHVSLYLGDGKVIDAPQPGTTIQVRDAWENDGNITTIRRILPAGDSAQAPASSGAPDAQALADLLASAQASRAAGAFS